MRLPARQERQAEGGRRLSRVIKNTPPPFLSVVTINLNKGNALKPTLDVVLDWPRDQVEHIVIDGGSTDQSLDLLKSYDKHLEYWVSEPDQGISDAFNKGISLCRGEVVGLINSGDWYTPSALLHVQAAFDQEPSLDVFCGNLQFWHDAQPTCRCDAIPRLLPREMTVTHPACFIRRQCYLRYGGYAPEFKLAMDYELLLRLFVRKCRFYRSSAVVANMPHSGIAEQQWYEALRETHQARQRHLPNSLLSSPLYLSFLILKRFCRIRLQSMGMHALVSIYREKYALVKKERTGADHG